MTNNKPTIDRNAYIFHLVAFTNKPREYGEKRTDEEVEEEYRKLILMD